MSIKRLIKSKYLVLGGIILVAYTVIAAIAPQIAPYGVNDQDLLSALMPPSEGHLFGTDPIGRDLFSRVVLGTRYSLLISVVSVLLGAVLGVPLGLVAGYYGGRTDAALMSAIDILLTFPVIVMAIAIVTVIGPGLTGLVVAIAITFAPRMARLIRGRALEVREEEFVQAAISQGASTWRVLMRHVLPNSLAPLIVEMTLRAGQAVLVAAALGFLGLGVQPPTPEWGTMISRGREYLAVASYLVVAPGLAISLLVMGFNLFGDGLRDILDPTLKNQGS